MRGTKPRRPLPAARAPVGGTLPERLRDLSAKELAASLRVQAAMRIEELETTMRQIGAQECECSENHAYDPACPHTLALLALSDPTADR